jgi:hypothetical protein
MYYIQSIRRHQSVGFPADEQLIRSSNTPIPYIHQELTFPDMDSAVALLECTSSHHTTTRKEVWDADLIQVMEGVSSLIASRQQRQEPGDLGHMLPVTGDAFLRLKILHFIPQTIVRNL